MWANSGTTQQRLAKRARVVLCRSAGLGWEAVSERSSLHVRNCMKWGERFARQRLDGLRDCPRPGAPRRISASQRNEVIRLACSAPPGANNQWTVRSLAAHVGLSVGAVHDILSSGEIKPHRIDYWCGKSPDPEFEAKQAAIIGLYMNPPENALVLSVDEKSQIQALDRTQPELPLRAGTPRRQTATYVRNGTTCLLAALAVHEGTVSARCIDSNNAESFLRFLKHLYRSNPRRHLHVIVDNLKVHKSALVQDWLAHRRRITLHFTPSYASWLNQIEIWFSIFSRDVIKGGIWKSKEQLISQIMGYIRQYNQERAKPFRWTYTGRPLNA